MEKFIQLCKMLLNCLNRLQYKYNKAHIKPLFIIKQKQLQDL